MESATVYANPIAFVTTDSRAEAFFSESTKDALEPSKFHSSGLLHRPTRVNDAAAEQAWHEAGDGEGFSEHGSLYS